MELDHPAIKIYAIAFEGRGPLLEVMRMGSRMTQLQREGLVPVRSLVVEWNQERKGLARIRGDRSIERSLEGRKNITGFIRG